MVKDNVTLAVNIIIGIIFIAYLLLGIICLKRNKKAEGVAFLVGAGLCFYHIITIIFENISWQR